MPPNLDATSEPSKTTMKGWFIGIRPNARGLLDACLLDSRSYTMSETPVSLHPLGSTAMPAANSSGRLQGRLGTLDIVFTVLAFNAPLTIVTSFFPLVMLMGNGLGAPISFLAAGSLLLLFAVGFTSMSRHVPNAGAYYAYITVGLGKPLGLGSALLAIVAYVFLILGSYQYGCIVWKQFAGYFFDVSGWPWWVFAGAAWLIVSAFGYLRISLSAKVLSVALVLEVLLVLAWELAIFLMKGPSAMTVDWLTPKAAVSGSVGLAILFAVTSFAGFEATAVFREEARNPSVTVPRATYMAIIIMALLFASANYFLIVGYSPEQVMEIAKNDPAGMTVASYSLFLGKAGRLAIDLLLCTSNIACTMALHNVLARYIYSLSTDGALPKSLSAVHVSYGSPYKASLLVTLFTATSIGVLWFANVQPEVGYGILGGVGGYGLLLLQIFTSLAVVMFFRRSNIRISRWKSFYAPLLSFMVLAACGYLAASNIDLMTGNVTVGIMLLAFMFVVMMGGAVYAIKLKNSKPDVYASIGRQKV
ncbi:APC family permease [Pseudomonas putida]